MRPSGAGGEGGRGRGAEEVSAPSRFSVDVTFFADEPFKCALSERSTKNVHENQQSKSGAS